MCFRSHFSIYWSVIQEFPKRTSYNISSNNPKAVFLRTKPTPKLKTQLSWWSACHSSMTDLSLDTVPGNKLGTAADARNPSAGKADRPSCYSMTGQVFLNQRLRFRELYFSDFCPLSLLSSTYLKTQVYILYVHVHMHTHTMAEW